MLARICCAVRRRASAAARAWTFASSSSDFVAVFSVGLFGDRVTILFSTLICGFGLSRFLSIETASGSCFGSFCVSGGGLLLTSACFGTGSGGLVCTGGGN